MNAGGGSLRNLQEIIKSLQIYALRWAGGLMQEPKSDPNILKPLFLKPGKTWHVIKQI